MFLNLEDKIYSKLEIRARVYMPYLDDEISLVFINTLNMGINSQRDKLSKH